MQNTQWKRNTGIFLASQAISLFGSSLVQFAITWHITLTTQSGIYATISILCSLLPNFFVSPFAGVWADRYERKKLIVLSDGFIALSTLLLAIVYMAGYQSLWLLFVVSAVRAAGGAIQSPAVSAMLPDMVPEDQLTRINGINGSIQSLLSLAAPALAGALLAIAGSIEVVFFVDVVTAAIAIYILLRHLHLPARKHRQTQQASYFAEIREGLSYIRKNAFLMHLIAACVLVYICVAPAAFLTPLQVVRSYGAEVWRMTGIEIGFSAGMLLGGLVISIWGGMKNRALMIGLCLFAQGLCSILLGVGIPFWAYLGIMGLFGMMLAGFNSPAMAVIQEQVDGAYMGRVFSVVSMLNSSLMPLGMLIFGPLADVVPIEILLVICGFVIVGCAIWLLLDRKVREVGRPRVKAAG